MRGKRDKCKDMVLKEARARCKTFTVCKEKSFEMKMHAEVLIHNNKDLGLKIRKSNLCYYGREYPASQIVRETLCGIYN